MVSNWYIVICLSLSIHNKVLFFHWGLISELFRVRGCFSICNLEFISLFMIDPVWWRLFLKQKAHVNWVFNFFCIIHRYSEPGVCSILSRIVKKYPFTWNQLFVWTFNIWFAKNRNFIDYR
jgi:hypothetical protein